MREFASRMWQVLIAFGGAYSAIHFIRQGNDPLAAFFIVATASQSVTIGIQVQRERDQIQHVRTKIAADREDTQ